MPVSRSAHGADRCLRRSGRAAATAMRSCPARWPLLEQRRQERPPGEPQRQHARQRQAGNGHAHAEAWSTRCVRTPHRQATKCHRPAWRPAWPGPQPCRCCCSPPSLPRLPRTPSASCLRAQQPGACGGPRRALHVGGLRRHARAAQLARSTHFRPATGGNQPATRRCRHPARDAQRRGTLARGDGELQPGRGGDRAQRTAGRRVLYEDRLTSSVQR